MTAGGTPRAQLERIFFAALAAVDPGVAVRRALASEAGELAIAGERLAPKQRIVLLAIGKAAGAMAAEFERTAGSRIAAGLAITAPGHGLRLDRIALTETSHPVPNPSCEAAARDALALVSGARPEDALVVLLSGGASSLCACPASGLALADLAATTSVLLADGVEIEELNTVRKHLSAIAGGGLAAAARSERIDVLAISDVPGDRIEVIGSGPLSADPSTYADAVAIVEDRNLVESLPKAVIDHLRAGARGERPETAKPGDETIRRVRTNLVATNATALAAARAAARRSGLEPRCAGALTGEARDAARRLIAESASSPEVDTCWIAGGETAVTVRGQGRGGRNQELALAAALEIDTRPGIALLAAGTDGIDGPTDAAGAYVDGGTLGRGRDRGVDGREALSRNDSHGFFSREGGVLRTGPTRTNVMDLALVRVAAARPTR